MAELRERELTVSGLRTPLAESGPEAAAEAVVFIHGNPGSHRDWLDLTARAGEFTRAVAFDMPGFGQAAKPRDFDYRPEGYAEFLEAAFAELAIDRVHLVLHDFGGPFGIGWAGAHPDRLGSAVVMNSGSLTNARWHKMAKLWRRPVVGELVMLATQRGRWRAAFENAAPPRLPAEFVDRMYDDYDRGTRRAVLKLYRATDLPYPPAERWYEVLAERDIPALIVWGARDPFVKARRAEQMKRAFPSAEIVGLPSSGHFPFADDPEGTAAAVIPFLRAQAAAGQSA
jgi:pimeloyl-ACP methyl ester carboxylesterase